MRLPLLLPALVMAGALEAQVVDHTRVRRYAGEEVTIRGPIARGVPMGGGVVWFSLGKPHPSASLVVVCWPTWPAISRIPAPTRVPPLRSWDGS